LHLWNTINLECAGGAFESKGHITTPHNDMPGEAVPMFKKLKGSLGNSVVMPASSNIGKFEHATVAEEFGAFKMMLATLPCEKMTTMELVHTCISLNKFPWMVHAMLWHMGLPATNAPSESVWSDMSGLCEGNWTKTTLEHVDLELSMKRNHDVVLHLRRFVECNPETLEQGHKQNISRKGSKYTV
jgi:hypothetical protein